MRAALIALLLCGCAVGASEQTPAVPTVRCFPVGQVPDGSKWWVYVCEFNGDTVVMESPDPVSV